MRERTGTVKVPGMYIEPWDLYEVEYRGEWPAPPETFVTELEDFEPLADYADGQPEVRWYMPAWDQSDGVDCRCVLCGEEWLLCPCGTEGVA